MTKLDDQFAAYQNARDRAATAQQNLATVVEEARTLGARIQEARETAEVAHKAVAEVLESAATIEARVHEAQREVARSVRTMRQASEALPSLIHSEYSGVSGVVKEILEGSDDDDVTEIGDDEYEELTEPDDSDTEAVPA